MEEGDNEEDDEGEENTLSWGGTRAKVSDPGSDLHEARERARGFSKGGRAREEEEGRRRRDEEREGGDPRTESER